MSKITVPSISRYCVFNFALLALILVWFWHQNQAVQMPEATLGNNEKIQCVSYSPYYRDGVTPLNINTKISPEQIDHDLAILSKKFACVRIYSVGQGLDHVPEAAKKLGMKVYLGAWIGWIKKLNEKELTLAIALANQYPETVKALIVGNEVLLRGEQSEASLKAYIERAKQSVRVPVTYADVWEFWRKHPKLESSVDFVTVHILPYWEDQPQPIDRAIDHTKNIMHILQTSFHKPILIGETGWPATGRQREGAQPGALNQALYIRSFLQVAKEKQWNYNLIEAFDQPWKRKLEGTVGGYWGIYTANFQQKFSFSGPASERHDGAKPLLAGLFGGILFLGLGLLSSKLNLKVALAWFTLGALAGIFALLQYEYLLAACRTPQEWLTLGGVAVLGWISLLSIPIYLSKQSAWAKALIQTTSIVLMLAALTANYLLVMDGRYRDFSISLYALPIIQIAIGLSLAQQRIRFQTKLLKWLGILLLISASACVSLEPTNLLAWAWLGLNLMLSFIHWPQKI
jgi:exo-beta-1,3-glucanase (GH17 family)